MKQLNLEHLLSITVSGENKGLKYLSGFNGVWNYVLTFISLAESITVISCVIFSFWASCPHSIHCAVQAQVCSFKGDQTNGSLEMPEYYGALFLTCF